MWTSWRQYLPVMNLGYGYDPETKAQSSQWKTWGSLRPKKSSQVQSKVKVTTVFLYHEGVIHHQYTPLLAKSTMSKFSMGCVMRCGTSSVHRGSEVTGSCAMTVPPPTHHTLSRTSWLNIRSLKYCGPPYSPEMSVCDFLLFLKVKMLLKGNRF